jgi:NAD(P)-dependent dehydrogenase (short-subunit alcohol dehydrogenase family)
MDAVIDLNLKAVFFLCQAVARQFIRQGEGGKIVNIPVTFREGQGIMAADNPGVVDQNIDPAHRRHRLVDQNGHIILLAEIRLNGMMP